MEKEYKPSELLIDIYKMFNVNDQRERMKQLTKKELYYLLLCCMDQHNEELPTVITNFSEFENEIDDILLLQENEKTNNPILQELINETNSTWIEVIELPKPYTLDEIRELKLSNILED